MSGTFTASRTNTYTEPRLRAVMPEIGADFYALAGAGIITLDIAQRWTDELMKWSPDLGPGAKLETGRSVC